MWRLTKYNWHEPLAYGAAVIATALGILGSLKSDPAWLSRAGAIVIVVGVLLASTRKIETLHNGILIFVDEYVKKHPETLRNEYRSIKGVEPSAAEEKMLEDALLQSIKGDITVEIERRRRIFRLHEIALVVVGTLMNGFGEWLMELSRAAMGLSRHAL